MCVWENAYHATVCAWRPEDNLLMPILFFFLHKADDDWIQAISLGSTFHSLSLDP